MASGRPQAECSFWSKTHHHVRLMAGPNAFICENSVAIYSEAFKNGSDDRTIHRTAEAIADCGEAPSCAETLCGY
jgi:hypothetical protein